MDSMLIEMAAYSDDVCDYALHAHNCYEIIYLKRGTLRLQVDRRQYQVQGPSLIFLNKLEQHSLQVVGDIYERYYLCISPVSAGNLIREYTLLTLLSNRPKDFSHVLDVASLQVEVERIFNACIDEQAQIMPYTNQRQAALLTDLLVQIYRQKPTLFTAESNKSISTIWSIQCRFEREYAEKINLSSLAEEYHMSVSYLSHLFKRITGYSVMEYLTMCRLSVAKKLLSETNMSVTDVVFATGFSDSSNFSRVFKREIGCSPMEYKRLEKEQMI